MTSFFPPHKPSAKHRAEGTVSSDVNWGATVDHHHESMYCTDFIIDTHSESMKIMWLPDYPKTYTGGARYCTVHRNPGIDKKVSRTTELMANASSLYVSGISDMILPIWTC